MAGIITSIPPLVEQPPGQTSSNPAGLPGVTYTVALLTLAQTWAALQTFPLGMISLNAADILGLPSALSGLLLVDQNITTAGPVAINSNTGIARVNQTVGAAITLTLALAANKACPVLIADWKGDAGTNNITINPTGTEKIQGLSSWKIAADNGSIFLRPIPGIGYAI